MKVTERFDHKIVLFGHFTLTESEYHVPAWTDVSANFAHEPIYDCSSTKVRYWYYFQHKHKARYQFGIHLEDNWR